MCEEYRERAEERMRKCVFCALNVGSGAVYFALCTFQLLTKLFLVWEYPVRFGTRSLFLIWKKIRMRWILCAEPLMRCAFEWFYNIEWENICLAEHDEDFLYPCACRSTQCKWKSVFCTIFTLQIFSFVTLLNAFRKKKKRREWKTLQRDFAFYYTVKCVYVCVRVNVST